MKAKITIALLCCIAVLLTCGLTVYIQLFRAPQPRQDEILLEIQLDTQEDIGLLLITYDINGSAGSGGISNADKTMLKRNNPLWWSFDQQQPEDSSEPVRITLQFAVVTEYCDPNYENIYPEELVSSLEELSLSANWGETCRITITGNVDNGYAVFPVSPQATGRISASSQ